MSILLEVVERRLVGEAIPDTGAAGDDSDLSSLDLGSALTSSLDPRADSRCSLPWRRQ